MNVLITVMVVGDEGPGSEYMFEVTIFNGSEYLLINRNKPLPDDIMDGKIVKRTIRDEAFGGLIFEVE